MDWQATQELRTYTELQEWLAMQQYVGAMSVDEVAAELVKRDTPDGEDALFYFGLLNQQLDTYGSWTEARDAFRQLSNEPRLSQSQRQLAAILERYNQSRINWYHKHLKLQQENFSLHEQLAAAQSEKVLLEQKIQAITDLETEISTRKEQ